MIRIDRLTKRYGRTRALDEITLDVPAGSVFAMVGPNGAGKTTAVKTLMNILQPDAGRVEVLGTDSRRLGAEQLAQIGYVSENQQLPDWMRVGSFFEYCKAFYPAWEDGDLAEMVRAFELPLDRRLKSLSRGMRMKAALAASLAYRPRLIVLDEPFSGLDVLVREQLIESIVERTPEATVFLASHDLADIESFATHIGYLNEGRLEFVEEIGATFARFREVEAQLDSPQPLPEDLPAAWLNPEQSSVVVRFTDSQFEAARTESEIRRHFRGVREIAVRTLPLRSIVIALARTAKAHRRIA
jgi:ABC-2 type transport system ATP-binding protein